MTPQDKMAGALSLHCCGKCNPTSIHFESRTIRCASQAGKACMFSVVQMNKISSAIIKTTKKTSHYF
jgi:hypothetical protein